MNVPRFKPSNWWYLPPGLAGGIYFLLNAHFPIITIVFFSIGGLTGTLFGYFFHCLFRENKHVKDWSMLLGTWVAVTSIWIYEQFYDSLIMLIAAL